MIASKKNLVLAFCLTLIGTAFAQENERKSDIGILLFSDNAARVGFEYRKPIQENAWFKLGGLMGSEGRYFSNVNSQIISASDSSVTLQYYQQNTQNFGITIGMERQMSNPIFSFSAGADIFYSFIDQEFFNQTSFLDEQGEWQDGGVNTYFPNFENPSSSRARNHFVNPNVYGAFNMNLPLGDEFIVSLTAKVAGGVPIYMGRTRVQDPSDKFIGTPGTTINMNMSGGIALRYLLGKKK